MYYIFLQGGRKFCIPRLRLPWLWAWWERRSYTKHKGRLIRLQDFPDWVFPFHFSAMHEIAYHLFISAAPGATRRN